MDPQPRWAATPLREALASLAARRLLTLAFVEEDLRLNCEAHVGYYRELVWILMMLELWVKRYLPRYSF